MSPTGAATSATTDPTPAVPVTEAVNQLVTMTFAPEHHERVPRARDGTGISEAVHDAIREAQAAVVAGAAAVAAAGGGSG